MGGIRPSRGVDNQRCLALGLPAFAPAGGGIGAFADRVERLLRWNFFAVSGRLFRHPSLRGLEFFVRQVRLFAKLLWTFEGHADHLGARPDALQVGVAPGRSRRRPMGGAMRGHPFRRLVRGVHGHTRRERDAGHHRGHRSHPVNAHSPITNGPRRAVGDSEARSERSQRSSHTLEHRLHVRRLQRQPARRLTGRVEKRGGNRRHARALAASDPPP